MKRTWKQIGSLLLAFCMVSTLLPTVAFAETVDVDSGTPLGVSETITAFEPLDEDVAIQTVEIGTTKEELKLPNKLVVTVTASTSDDEAVNGDDIATDSDAQEKETPKETQTTVAVSEWASDPSYDGNVGGLYTFTPVLELPDGVTVADGVSAPTITVTTEEAVARGSVAAAVSGSLTIGIEGSDTADIVSDLTQDGSGECGTLNWSWNAAVATLTLEDKNLAFTMLDPIKFDAAGDVTIAVPSGKTASVLTISYMNNSAGTLTITGGTLNAFVSGSTPAIQTENGLTITGGVTVNVRAQTAGLRAIHCGGSITLNSGTLTTGDSGSGGDIYSGGGFTINETDGAVKVTINGFAFGDLSVSAGTVIVTAMVDGDLAVSGGNVTTGTVKGTTTHTGGTLNGNSPGSTVPVNAATPDITSQPVGTNYDKNAPATPLFVMASVTDGGTISYQWYYNSSNNTTGGAPIDGATNASYTPPTTTVGTVYYYCVVKNTNDSATENKTATATSNTAAVTVTAAAAPTVSGFRAVRTDADSVRFFFTPSIIGKYGYSILKQGLAEPSNIPLFHDILSIGEFDIDATHFGTTASDILVIYLQIENAAGIKSQIYSIEVPAYTPPTDAKVPSISEQPTSATYLQDTVAIDLLVLANSTDGGSLSYQWYCNTTNTTVGGTPVASSSINACTPSTSTVGTTYYYCVVTNTNEAATNKNATTTSDIAKVTVNPPGGTIIRSITVTGIVEPVGGAAPVKTGATVPEGANYALRGDIVWVDDENKTEPLADGAKFEAGKRYFCGVSVNLPSGHSFAHDVTATINGKTATVMLDGTSEAVVSYLFTAKDATDTPTITVTKHPQNVTVTQGRISGTLTTEAFASNGKPVLYQWHRFIGGIGSNNTQPLLGETSNTFAIPTGLTAGTYQYLCIFNTDGTDYTDSNSAIVTVNPPSGSGGNGGGGGNGGLGVVVTPPAPDASNAPTQGSVNIPGTVDASGNVTANVTNQTVSDAIDKALAQARQNGTEQNGITLTINISTGGKPVNNLSANLPKEVLNAVIAKGVSGLIITAGGSDIAIGMDLAALREMNRQAGGNISLTATRRNNATLAGNARAAIGNRPVFDLKANYGNGSTVQNFGAGSVSITIPYTLGTNENAGNIQAVYVNANGKVQWLMSSVYDSVNGVLRFSTNHFSTYGVGYKQDAPSFADIGTHWAKEDIAFVANRGLLSGTSKTTFSPNTAMTRGMFVTALGRLANADVSGYEKSSFTDVKSDDYHMGYVEWANKNNIVKGIGDGKFAPDQSITREQMAVILQSYAKAIGFTLPKVHAENTFADSAKIGAYAKDAVKQMQMAGIISGKNSNLFDPQGTATRAEVSAVLRRFVELAISSDTAQGWTMNDSGKWMYYENGKPVTGKKNIGGSIYTFDQYGVTADVPKNLRYNTYTVQKGDSFWLIAHKLGCTMSELERLNNKSRFDIIHPGDVLRVPEE